MASSSAKSWSAAAKSAAIPDSPAKSPLIPRSFESLGGHRGAGFLRHAFFAVRPKTHPGCAHFLVAVNESVPEKVLRNGPRRDYPLRIMLYALIGLAVVLGIFALVAVAMYNGLIAANQTVKTARSQIDVLLKRRYDLIPNLVETVKGYAKHESGTLEAVIKARNGAVSAAQSGDAAAMGQAEGQLNGALRQLFAVAEAYPDLKANQNFAQLQGELVNTENQIAGAGGRFNETVRDYNTRMMTFPTNLVAGIFGFRAEPYFEVTDPVTREAPKVQF